MNEHFSGDGVVLDSNSHVCNIMTDLHLCMHIHEISNCKCVCASQSWYVHNNRGETPLIIICVDSLGMKSVSRMS